jgi:nucleotide-binding universal stress UspA family protein
MKPIVCATRGGEACRRTQERAIDLAKERDAELIFLYIVDPSLVGPVDESLAEALNDEMTRMGRSLMRIAQGRARERDVTAQAVVRHGAVQQNIKDFVCEVGASTLVIGAPRTGTVPQAFTPTGIQRFAQEVHEETGVEVVVVT